jgi:hypothetical protein
MARLIVRLESCERQLANIPSRFGGHEPFYSLSVIGGNTLSSGQAGIKHIAELVTEVPSNYDPNTLPSCDDGWGYGYLYIDGEVQDDLVLIVNDQHGSLGDIVETNPFFSRGPISLPVAGSPNTFKQVFAGFTL